VQIKYHIRYLKSLFNNTVFEIVFDSFKMKFVTYVKESYLELKENVTWITWEEAQKSTAVVALFTVIFAILIFLADKSFQLILKNLFQLF